MRRNNLNKTIISCIFIGLFIYLIQFGMNFGLENFSSVDRKFIDINQTNCDFIFIGNSMLVKNVNQSIFEQELFNLTGKKIKPLYIVNNGKLPNYYLSIKNQIIASNKRNIPIIIIGSEDSPIANDDPMAQERMNGDESVYYSIRGEPESINERFERIVGWLTSKRLIAGYIQELFINIFSFKKISNAESILQERFTIGQFKDIKDINIEVQPITDLIDQGYREITNISQNKYRPVTDNEKIMAGFFPEIIHITKNRFTIIYIDSHMNPEKDTGYLRNFRKNLSQYLKINNITYIDLNNRPELNFSELFADRHHYNKELSNIKNESINVSGIPLNSRIIAEEIYNLLIL